jgi:hypothetical protein
MITRRTENARLSWAILTFRLPVEAGIKVSEGRKPKDEAYFICCSRWRLILCEVGHSQLGITRGTPPRSTSGRGPLGARAAAPVPYKDASS